MTTIHQRYLILESLDSLDQGQMEKVLSYIKGVSRHADRRESPAEKLKREALRQIRQALIEKHPTTF